MTKPLSYPAFRIELAKWLANASGRKNMADLAAQSGVSHDRLGRIALGSADVTAAWELYAICQVLGPCAPPIPFAPELLTLAQTMKLARSLKPDEREALIVCCYATIAGALIDADYAREHDEWPLVVPDKLVAKLQRRGLASQVGRFDLYPEDPGPNRAICVRTYPGNAVAEILGRES